MPETPSIPEVREIEAAIGRINLLCVLDHSGRSGNGFFLTVFDQHPEVISCPLIHYTYSYMHAKFPGENTIDAAAAWDFATEESYFRYVYQPPEGDVAEMILRMGGETDADIDRGMARRVFDTYMSSRKTVSRRELAALPLIAVAVARGRDLRQLRYVILSDAVSLKTENVLEGFSGDVVDHILEDWPDAKLVSLVRDPRSTYASSRHQFVNSLGNNYALTPKTFFVRLSELLHRDFQMEIGNVWLFWLLFLVETERTIERKKAQYSKNFVTLRNEDLNLSFSPTIKRLSEWLGISGDFAPWHSGDFKPTMVGSVWKGTGAYNSRYQRFTDGILPNDPDALTGQLGKPNKIVTERWRSKLRHGEKVLIERLMGEEMAAYAYVREFDNPNHSDFRVVVGAVFRPFSGEFPTWRWLKLGTKKGAGEVVNRFSYGALMLPFAIVSRMFLLYFVLLEKRFRNVLPMDDRGAPLLKPEPVAIETSLE